MIDEQKLDGWIEEHFDEYISLLTDYVAIPSIAKPGADGLPFGKACADALDFMERTMRRYGLATDDVDKRVMIGTLSGTCTAQPDCKTIGIACHGDVVPPEGDWAKNPYTLWKNGDWLTGRGSTDNKGATIAVLFALRYLQEQGLKLRNNVNLYVGSAEEIGMYDMDYLVEHRPLPDFTLVPDAGFPVCYGEKGSMKFEAKAPVGDTNLRSFTAGDRGASVAALATAELAPVMNPQEMAQALNGFTGITAQTVGKNGIVVTSHGKARHTAFPDGGIDAIGQLARALDSVGTITGPAKDLIAYIGAVTVDFHGKGLGVPLEDEESGKLSDVLTVTRLNDGNLSIRFNVRYPVTADAVSLEAKIKKNINAGGFSFTEFQNSPASVAKLTPLIHELCDIANKVHGTDDPPYIMGGGTYARKLQPAVAYGMGTPSINIDPPYPVGQGRAHQPNESVYIPRMKKGIKIYAQALLAIDKAL